MRSILLILQMLPALAWAAPPDEECMVQKSYERPPNIFRMTPQEHKAAQELVLKNPPPGAMREDGTIVRPKKWCPDPDDVQSLRSDPNKPLEAVIQPGAPHHEKKDKDEKLLQGKLERRPSFPMTPNDIEKAAKQMDQSYEDYEATLPECPQKIKRGQVCIEKSYREKLKSERRDRERKEKGGS